MSNTATRLITLIMLLQRRPNQKAANLADKLGVSVRTLHRYFAMLDEMGIPVYSERGPYGGFSLVPGYRMPPLVFSPQESVAVTLGIGMVEEMWGSMYAEAARSAMAKIESVLPDEQRQEVSWARRALLVQGMQRADFASISPALESLRRAIRQARRIHLVYRSGERSEVTSRRVDPYALVHRFGWWYIVGWCHLRRDERIFRIDRIQELRLLEEQFDPPEDFDVRVYTETQFQAPEPVRARLRFVPEFSFLALGNRAMWESLEELKDGSVVTTLTTPDIHWAATTVLSFGPSVEVLDPPELRRLVFDWARAVAETYAHNREPESIQPESPGTFRSKTNITG